MSVWLQPALLTGLVLVVTEYRLQSRARAIQRLAGPWRPGPALIRLAGWLVVGFLGGLWRVPLGWAPLVISVLATELGVLILHRQLRRDAARAAPHGRPWTHLIPLGTAMAVSLGVQWVTALLRMPPFEWYPLQLDRPMAAVTALVWLGTWATLLTVSVIEITRPNQVSDESGARPGAGELIGLLERALVFVLVLAGSLPSVGFVVAFKSAARFPQFKDPEFAEYFLIGTLTSVGLAAMAALGVQWGP
jgi:hypothetical protein